MQTKVSALLKAVMYLEACHIEIAGMENCQEKWLALEAIEKAHDIIFKKHTLRIESMNGNICND